MTFKIPFNTFVVDKIPIAHPDMVNVILFALLVAAVFLSVRRNTATGTELLSRSQTVELKGLVIICVVVGHLWVHVASVKPAIILSGEAVSMFLLLSGFGITRSAGKLDVPRFIKRRGKRVLVPYWIATVVILGLDYLLLKKTCSVDDMLMTMAGLNFELSLRLLDYVRWFVTFILFWYTVFLILKLVVPEKKKFSLALLIGAGIAFIIHYYFLEIGWYQFFSFPLGCIAGLYFEELLQLYKKKAPVFCLFAILSLLYVLSYKTLFSMDLIHHRAKALLPTVGLKMIFELNSVLLSCAFIILYHQIMKRGYRSAFLGAVGKYSYEIYLIHGVFLVKYNFFFFKFSPLLIILEFVLFFIFVYFSAFALSRTANFINQKIV